MEFRRKMWPSELVSLVFYQRTFCGDVQGTLGNVSLELPREVSHSFDGSFSKKSSEGYRERRGSEVSMLAMGVT